MAPMPARSFIERRLRLFPVADAFTDAQDRIGAPVTLTAGEITVAAPAGAILGFLAECANPANNPEFSTGGAAADSGGAFVVDVHPGHALVQVADEDATFIMEIYTDSADPATQVNGADADVGVSYGLGIIDGVAVVNKFTTGDLRVVSVVERPQGAGTPGEPSGYNLVEVMVESPLFT